MVTFQVGHRGWWSPSDLAASSASAPSQASSTSSATPTPPPDNLGRSAFPELDLGRRLNAADPSTTSTSSTPSRTSLQLSAWGPRYPLFSPQSLMPQEFTS